MTMAGDHGFTGHRNVDLWQAADGCGFLDIVILKETEENKDHIALESACNIL